jgi:hypothetical protein
MHGSDSPTASPTILPRCRRSCGVGGRAMPASPAASNWALTLRLGDASPRVTVQAGKQLPRSPRRFTWRRLLSDHDNPVMP